MPLKYAVCFLLSLLGIPYHDIYLLGFGGGGYLGSSQPGFLVRHREWLHCLRGNYWREKSFRFGGLWQDYLQDDDPVLVPHPNACDNYGSRHHSTCCPWLYLLGRHDHHCQRERVAEIYAAVNSFRPSFLGTFVHWWNHPYNLWFLFSDLVRWNWTRRICPARSCRSFFGWTCPRRRALRVACPACCICSPFRQLTRNANSPCDYSWHLRLFPGHLWLMWNPLNIQNPSF